MRPEHVADRGRLRGASSGIISRRAQSSGLPGRLQDPLRDGVRLRNQREVTRFHLDRRETVICRQQSPADANCWRASRGSRGQRHPSIKRFVQPVERRPIEQRPVRHLAVIACAFGRIPPPCPSTGASSGCGGVPIRWPFRKPHEERERSPGR
jgi:hypothetical protein